MIVAGLTGSIATGKSTTAAMFSQRGVPVHDADATVHRLYRGEAVAAVEAAFPGVTVNGAIDRTRLSAMVLGQSEAMQRLEAIVHPLVRAEENRFLEAARATGAAVAVLDVPLLFETGGEARCDVVIVVSCDPVIQRERALSRPGMTVERFEAMLARQMPDAEKRRRADFVIDTSQSLADTERQVDEILRALAARPSSSA